MRFSFVSLENCGWQQSTSVPVFDEEDLEYDDYEIPLASSHSEIENISYDPFSEVGFDFNDNSATEEFDSELLHIYYGTEDGDCDFQSNVDYDKCDNVSYIGLLNDDQWLRYSERKRSLAEPVAPSTDIGRVRKRSRSSLTDKAAEASSSLFLLPTYSLTAYTDEEFELQLADEPNRTQTFSENLPHCFEKAPVPLLTPPGSPLTVVLDSGTATVCEWPSNLIVDRAIQAAKELRPLSPTSLEMLEIDEQHRIGWIVKSYH